MGSYGSQSVESISNLMAHEAEMKAKQKKQAEQYRMPDEQVVTVIMPVGLIRKVAREETMTDEDMSQVKSAMQHALWDEQ